MLHRQPREIPNDNPRVKQSAVAHRVGDYFDALGRTLLRWREGEGLLWAPQRKLPQNCPGGDLYHERLNSWLEIKGAGSNPFKIYSSQLGSHIKEAEAGFPTDSYLYLLFWYTNKSNLGGKNHRLIGAATDQRELERILASHTRDCYVVDVRVLAALWQKSGACRDLRHSDWDKEENRSMVPVTETILQKLADDTRQELVRLDLPRKFRRRFLRDPKDENKLVRSIQPIDISLKFRQRLVKFQLFLIVPTVMRERIEKLVLANGNGH
ncbi:MAG: hypothetical protein HY978_00435 [Candidatus Liptonbacteria bacterium]|nr:hypothetical protein [Candidatus Liptonbacteria bacterium]